MSDNFSDLIDGFNNSDGKSDDNHNTIKSKEQKNNKSVTSSQFILILLFIFISFVIGVCVHNYLYWLD